MCGSSQSLQFYGGIEEITIIHSIQDLTTYIKDYNLEPSDRIHQLLRRRCKMTYMNSPMKKT
ncbi:hypothetical protein GQ55_9G291100 [Panicum hallii var. hallii]|uniref:Uncharacterized protein n=1 Tax=Panicum hallii var. hallii TaxID=1504633 RepID=A0A2T7C7N1_9POAL|nr:hypothetical protein GQ55_9G291100 [Panicum hallii var. hallii]